MSHYRLNEDNNLVQLRDFNIASLFKQDDGNQAKHVSSSKENKAKFKAQVPSLLVEFFINQEKVSLTDLMFTLEKNILMKVLAQCNGNIKKSSKFLGIKYTTLHEKLKKYNISIRSHPVEN